MEPSSRKLLSNKPYRLLISSQLISNLGDWLSLLAVFTLVGLKWNATPFEVSLIVLSLAIPMTLLGPLSGVFADRLERKYIMIASDIARGFIIMGLVFAEDLWHIYTLLFLLGTCSSIFNPAKNGKLKEIVPNHHMQQAASISSLIENGTKIIGPALSGFLLAIWDIQIIFIIDSLSFFISAFLLIKLPISHIHQFETGTGTKKNQKQSILQELTEGLIYIKSVPFIFYGIILMAVMMLVLQMADSQFVLLFRELKEVSSSLIGTVMTASGGGFIIAGLILSKVQINKPVNSMIAGCFILGLGFGSIALLTQFQTPYPFIWASLLACLGSSGAGFVFIPFQSTVLQETPAEMSGRTLGTIGSIMMFSSLVGPLTGGVIGSYLGVTSLFLISSSGLCIISVIAFFLRKPFGREKEVYVAQSNRGAQRAT
ncbi:MFS transporter [Fictibacillus phosphorivorans]|uniref:MFS transporter n=1 Tax=Fictibacillus phosphorivorans TaxID=1221500 RepID=UPI00129410D8|nr:MFS transporter [Fictibacillus phosphorivorans]